MSFMQRPALKWPGEERGIAITSEYVVLLGVSMLIFTAVFIGFNSFGNTASADARSSGAYRVAAQVSERLSGVALDRASASESIDIPGRICGSPYIVYPSRDGRSICVLVDGIEQEAPIPVSATTKMEGFMVSLPTRHRIDYDPYSKTLMLA